MAGDEEEILLKTSRLAASIKPFEVKLTTIGYLNEYFRCLFIKAEKTERQVENWRRVKELALK